MCEEGRGEGGGFPRACASPPFQTERGLWSSPKGEQMSAQIMSLTLFVSPPSSCLCDFLRPSFLPPLCSSPFCSFSLSWSLCLPSFPSILCPRVLEAAGRTVLDLATGGSDKHLRARPCPCVCPLGDRRGFIVSIAARVRRSSGRPLV